MTAPFARRSFHKIALASALGALASAPAQAASAGRKTFVLVHGAWYGGWCWTQVASALRARGHLVSTPTCPGLGELRSMLSREITLTTFIDAIVDHIYFENLQDVILVGSGFSGVVISGVADRMPAALSKLVYLDAMVLPSGSSVFEAQPAAITKKRLEQAQKEGGGIAIPAPPADSYHIEDPAMLKRVAQRLTPHPLGTYTEKLVLRHPLGNGVPKVYVDCNAAVYAPLADIKRLVKTQPDWQWKELNAHHDPMITEPDLLADYLNAI